MTSPASALHQLFVRSWDSAHHGLYCSHVCAYTHHSSFQHLSSVFAFVIFQFSDRRTAECAAASQHHMVKSLLLHGYSALPHSLQQLQAGASSSSPVQTSASTQESNGTAPSSSVSCPQGTHSAISPQVLAGPTRNVTGDVMSATLAEDAPQLSCVEFLERCNLLRVSPPHPQPNPTLLLDAATQTFPRTAPADVSTQLPLAEFSLGCIYPEDPLDWSHLRHMALPARHVHDPSLLFSYTQLRRLLHTVSILPMPPPNHLSRSSSSGASTPMTL